MCRDTRSANISEPPSAFPRSPKFAFIWIEPTTFLGSASRSSRHIIRATTFEKPPPSIQAEATLEARRFDVARGNARFRTGSAATIIERAAEPSPQSLRCRAKLDQSSAHRSDSEGCERRGRAPRPRLLGRHRCVGHPSPRYQHTIIASGQLLPTAFQCRRMCRNQGRHRRGRQRATRPIADLRSA